MPNRPWFSGPAASSAGQLQEAVLAAAPMNVKAVGKDLHFVDFTVIEEYATKHPRTARYLASIVAQKGTKNISKSALKGLCRKTGVDVGESKGKITVDKGQVMGFLEVVDRLEHYTHRKKKRANNPPVGLVTPDTDRDATPLFRGQGKRKGDHSRFRPSRCMFTNALIPARSSSPSVGRTARISCKVRCSAISRKTRPSGKRWTSTSTNTTGRTADRRR